mgnify:CR=1 FL=1|tara:strand:+ start:450 stop:854 length:405 start_codon:yes stop_codon:yes gene_type:complete
MASELKVNTLTGVSTAGSIAVTAEGNSTTTNLQQGLAKCWFQITQDSSHSIDDSFNVGSIADGGAGETTVNFTNAMANSDWSGLLTAQSSNNRRAVNNAPNTTRIKVETYQVDSNTSATDATGGVSGAVHGDLA